MKPQLPGSRRKRVASLILAAIATLAVVAWAASDRDAGDAYKTAPVAVADIEDTVIATGTVDAAQMVDVGAQASGQVKSLAVALGERVKSGDLIAEIDATQQKNAVRDAQAALDSLRAQRAQQVAMLDKDRRAFARQKEMLSLQATSRADYDGARATLASSRAQVAASDAQLRQSETQLDTERAKLGYTRITAPIDGTVVAVVVRQGQTVNAMQTAPTIVKLARLDAMLVRAAISEADVVKVKPGQMVYFTILGNPDKRYYGRLKTIEPAPDSIKSAGNGSGGASPAGSTQAVYYNGLFEVPNPDGELRIAMTAQVHVVLAQARDVLTIPSSALGEKATDGRHTVTVIDGDGQVASRKVEVGISDGMRVQVRTGLKAGEHVVISKTPSGGGDATDDDAGEA